MAANLLNAQDWRVIRCCLQRCANQADTQLNKGHMDGCSGTAWFFTQQMLEEVRRLLPIIEEKCNV